MSSPCTSNTTCNSSSRFQRFIALDRFCPLYTQMLRALMRSDLLFNDTLRSLALTTAEMVSIDRIHINGTLPRYYWD